MARTSWAIAASRGLASPGCGCVTRAGRRGWLPRSIAGGGYRGRGCAQVTNHSAFSAEPAGWAQRVEVPGGHELVLVGRIRTRNLKGAAFLRLDCYGVAPGQQGGEPVRLASAASQEVTEGEQPWSEVRVRLRTPEGTRYVDAACLMQGRGTAWFDEVQLLPVRGE